MDKKTRVMTFLVTIETPEEVTIDGAESIVKSAVKDGLPKDYVYKMTLLHSVQNRKEPMVGYPDGPESKTK